MGLLRREVLQSIAGASAPCWKSAVSDVTEVVRRVAEQCIRNGDIDAAEELFAPGYRCRGSFGEWDRQEWIETVQLLREAVSGLRVTIHEMFPASDRVTVRWTLEGTERSTGRPFRLDGISIERLAGDRIVESHVAADVLPCLRRLGLASERESL